jgi:GH24 family phage-related lysozyme (muramidase)
MGNQKSTVAVVKYQASARCISKACEVESFRAKPYRDGGGLFTRGYGERCAEDAPEVTEPEARAALATRFNNIAEWLEPYLPGLMQHQVDSLLLFLDNCGIGNFLHEPMYQLLRGRSWSALVHWNSYIHDATGNVELGLVLRRQFETQLFVYGWQPLATEPASS